MIARIFDVSGIVIIAVITVAAFIWAAIDRAVNNPDLKAAGKDEKSVVMGGVEAATLALLGGFAARTFISLLMGSANDSPGAGLAIGWGFFLAPGLVDTFARIAGNQPILTTASNLLIFASVVGSFTGMMAGIYETYDWEGLGLLSFPVDVTWALAGNTIAGLMHLINLGWGDHEDDTRTNAHRYKSGFSMFGFTFTQGDVMSSCPDNLRKHEMTHVWQGRVFGPLYTLTYIAWLLVWLIPSFVAGLIVTKGPSGLAKGPMRWCYFNNPWEAWAYGVQGNAAHDNARNECDDDESHLTWRPLFVVLWAIPFYLVSAGLASFVFYSSWINTSQPAAPKSTKPANKPAQHKKAEIPKSGYLETLREAKVCDPQLIAPGQRILAETHLSREYRS
jgi:hypothetical protein